MNIKIQLTPSISKIHYLIISILCFYVLSTKAKALTYTDSQGVIYTYSGSTASVTGYTSLSGSVTIPAAINVGGTSYDVTSIANNALYSAGMTTVTISGSVVNIGSYSFNQCTSLTNVTMQQGVAVIGASAFERCTSLQVVTIPASVVEIDSFAFETGMNFYPTTFNFLGALPNTIGVGIFDFLHNGIINYPNNQISWEGYTFGGANYGFTYNAIGLSSDATLSNLYISLGALTPTFSSGAASYVASVANNISSITVTPTVNQANATVKVNGTTVSSGSSSGSVNLSVGSNTITILASAQDGTTTHTYTVTVTRALPAPAITSALTASGTVGSAFTYTITASNTPTSYVIGTLPAGLTPSGLVISPVISGTPTAVGTTSVRISALNGGDPGSATLVITIAAAPAPVIPSKIAAGISITNTTQTYTGKPLPVTTSLSPSTLSAAVVYYPGFNVPTDAGTYYVLVNVVDNTYYCLLYTSPSPRD